ncbi:MAG: hypothetical protein JXB14_04670 [Candidatus Altiarchaeota archaeon]|nr:hypothetical protein [Candidatus Altiarchaeota archaeon]
MSTKKFSNQSLEQVIGHLGSNLAPGIKYDVRLDTFANHVEIDPAVRTGGHGSMKRDRIRDAAGSMKPRRRKLAMSAKRREKPKLKHVRNGRMITLKGYTG